MNVLKSLLLSVLLLSPLAVLAAPVNINTASADQLATSLKGVGESKARAIVDYRTQHGAFKTADDLAQVKGIGERTVELNRQDILLD